MAITDEERHEMHKHFEESMGPRMAANLMGLLPPVGWDDLATKQDLAHQREVIGEQFKHTWAVMATTTDIETVRTHVETVRTHVERVHNEMNRALRLHLLAIAMLVLTLANLLR